MVVGNEYMDYSPKNKKETHYVIRWINLDFSLFYIAICVYYILIIIDIID